ncbi:MAG: glycoside hydrolase family 2 protein [Promethearchaeota archaeon]
MNADLYTYLKKRAVIFIVLLILLISSLTMVWSYLPYIDEERFSPAGDDKLTLSDWKFKTDKDDIGLNEKWFVSTYDDSSWEDVVVPSTWNTDPELEWYKGFGWYRTHFSFPQSWRTNESVVYIHFLAVFLKCDVWINNHYLGYHRGGYTDFSFDISDQLKRENTITVRVDNSLKNKQIPGKSFDWWFYGGITREVFVEKHPRLWISDISITTKVFPNDLALINVTCTIYNQFNSDLKGNIKLDIVTDDNIRTHSSTFTFSIKHNTHYQWSRAILVSNPNLWSPESPFLYMVICDISLDNIVVHRVVERFGIREIKTVGTALYLNNRMIFLKGFSRHEDYPGYGNSLPYDIQYNDLKMIKESGANFIRLAHYPNHPSVLDICDELGLLVWEEIPAWQILPEFLSNPEIVEKWAKPQLKEMIQRHKNHPSIIIWSIGNEFDTGSSLSLPYISEMVRYAKQLDPTRLTTYATNKYQRDMGYAFIDVISINAYQGWYTAKISDFGKVVDDIHKYNPEKPIFMSEFGAGAVLGKRGTGKFTEDFQVEFLKNYWSQIRERMSGNETNTGYIIGAAWWIFADFKSPKRVNSPIQNYNLKGVVDQLRRPKLAYFEITSLFANTPNNSKIFGNTLLMTCGTTSELSRQHSLGKNFRNQGSNIHILKKYSIHMDFGLKTPYRYFFEFLKTTLKSIAFKSMRYVYVPECRLLYTFEIIMRAKIIFEKWGLI